VIEEWRSIVAGPSTLDAARTITLIRSAPQALGGALIDRDCWEPTNSRALKGRQPLGAEPNCPKTKPFDTYMTERPLTRAEWAALPMLVAFSWLRQPRFYAHLQQDGVELIPRFRRDVRLMRGGGRGDTAVHAQRSHPWSLTRPAGEGGTVPTLHLTSQWSRPPTASATLPPLAAAHRGGRRISGGDARNCLEHLVV
jgi:hypothetical protein